MEVELKKEVEAAGSLITNDSDVSPFWRLVRGVVITPALWLIRTLLAGHVLPASFAATANDTYLDLKAWDVDLTRRPPRKPGAWSTSPRSIRQRPSPSRPMSGSPPSASTAPSIACAHCKEMVSPAGEAIAKVVCEAEFAGSAWNLAPGYYNLLSKPVTGILSARNADRDWSPHRGPMLRATMLWGCAFRTSSLR